MIYRKDEACMSVQLIPTNQRKRRRFTPQQKLKVLKEWELMSIQPMLTSIMITMT
jgi:hypothetical protein